MEKQLKAIVIGVIAIIGLLSVMIFRDSVNIPFTGSVDRNGTYQSQNLSLLSTTSAVLFKTGSATLGSVVLATTTDTAFTLYDVAAASNYDSPTSTISQKIIAFPAYTPAGTYTFDLNVFRGLVYYAAATSSKEVIVTFR